MIEQTTLSLVLSLISLAASAIGLLLAIFRRLHACSCCGIACLFKSSLQPNVAGAVNERALSVGDSIV